MSRPVLLPPRGQSVRHHSLHVCACACMCVPRASERSFSICVMHLALKRAVICKSSLPWAGGVELGRGDKEEGGRGQEDGDGQRQHVNDRHECETEGGKWVWEWFILHNWLCSAELNSSGEHAWQRVMRRCRIHHRTINAPTLSCRLNAPLCYRQQKLETKAATEAIIIFTDA